MSLRYTLHLLQPDGSYASHASGDGPGDDLDTPALPDAITQALAALYGDRWTLTPTSAGGWYVGRVNSARRIRLCADLGVTSTDGTSPTLYADTSPALGLAARADAHPMLPLGTA